MNSNLSKAVLVAIYELSELIQYKKQNKSSYTKELKAVKALHALKPKIKLEIKGGGLWKLKRIKSAFIARPL